MSVTDDTYNILQKDSTGSEKPVHDEDRIDRSHGRMPIYLTPKLPEQDLMSGEPYQKTSKSPGSYEPETPKGKAHGRIDDFEAQIPLIH